MKNILASFDRSFSNGKGRQFFVYWWGISSILSSSLTPIRIIEFMIDSGAFKEDGDRLLPRLWSLFSAISGAFVFTGMNISLVFNFLDVRATRFLTSQEKYRFNNYILFQGANEMVAALVCSLQEQRRLGNRPLGNILQ